MFSGPRSLSVTMPACAVQPCDQDEAWVCCLNCLDPLDLYQPESQDPERLVGTCHGCGRWYLLDWDPISGNGLMLLLPDRDQLRASPSDVG